MTKTTKMGARCDMLGLMSVAALALALTGGACGDVSPEDLDPNVTGEKSLAGTLNDLLTGEGGELVGPAGTPFAGLRLSIPPGALKAPTRIVVREAEPTTKLPDTAVKVGRSFSLEPSGLTLTTPASLTLPFDAKAVSNRKRAASDVRLWVLDAGRWSQLLQAQSSAESVTVRLPSLFGSTAPGLPAEGY